MSEEEKRTEGENPEAVEQSATEGAASTTVEEGTASAESGGATTESSATESGSASAEGASNAEESKEASETVQTEEPKKVSEPPKANIAASVAHEPAAHGHSHGDHGHGHDDHGHGGHGHVASMMVLLGVLGALGILTIITVMVTMVDLGSQWNFVVAMIIATVKAALVMGYFMHLVHDSKFNVVVFTSSFLFVLLFLSMSVLDRSEYQPRVDEFEAAAKLQSAN